jgi:hypothetical protein
MLPIFSTNGNFIGKIAQLMRDLRSELGEVDFDSGDGCASTCRGEGRQEEGVAQ